MLDRALLFIPNQKAWDSDLANNARMLDEEINPRQLRQINEMQWKQLWNIAYQEDVSETKLVVSKEFEK